MDGFEDREVLDYNTFGTGLVTDFAWTPQGQLLAVMKEGQLLVFEDPYDDSSYSLKTTALDLTSVLCVNGERGFQGIEVHPDINKTQFIYVYYTFNKNGNCDEDPFKGPDNRFSSFILPETNIIDINSETGFFETPSLAYDHHNAGDIAFGNDGYLCIGERRRFYL